MAQTEKTADRKTDKRIKRIKKRRPASAAKAAGSGEQRPAPRRRRRRHGRLTLNYLLFGILGFIVLMLLCYFVFFKVYRITITGDIGNYSEQEIIEASGIEMKDSLFSVDQKTVYARVVGALPYVQTVVVHKKFPTTVELEVALSKPVGAVQKDGQYLYINTDGRILENGLADYDRSYPRILGINATSTEEGSYVLNQNSEQIVMLKKVLTAIESSGIEKINLISVADRLNIRIMYEERLLIELGTEADLDWKLQFIRASIENNISSTAKAVLDASMLDDIGRVFYREERDLYAILEQETEQAPTVGEGEQVQPGTVQGNENSAGSASQGPKFQVDPQTGDIIVGLQDPLNPNASSAGVQEPNSSSQNSSSSQPSGDAASSASSSSSSAAVSSGSSETEDSSSADSSSSGAPASSKAPIGPAAPRRSSRSSSSEETT